MCSLYSLTKDQASIRRFFDVGHDLAGNLPLLPAIFPDMMAPIVRVGAEGERQLELMRWGMPCPPQFGTHMAANIRDTYNPHWQHWLGPESRCLVPATSFCEWTDSNPKVPNWFAIDEARPMFAFAGIWTPWTGAGAPRADPVEGHHPLYAFLTTEANDVVRPIHAAAMPVILTTEEEFELWLTAPASEVPHMQRPLLNELLTIVAKGEMSDGRG